MKISDLIPDPVTRSLRIFAFDPGISAQVENASIGIITIGVPWEGNLEPGPVGEYIEVVDADPASSCFYQPVDLNDPKILAQDGLEPVESNPQFHQQMVYAVAMATIVQFEQALGRVALWSSRWSQSNRKTQFVRRLRIYPHALRDRNAYYSPDKRALLFGYFPVGIRDADNTPGTIVFTCLSHDIIAHETAHALLDGVHPRFSEAINPDVLAFHEAFADIVALFQHFSYPGVLHSQIARTRGNLATENLLSQLAQQFGKASGRGEALRDALGKKNPVTGVWEPRKPDVRALDHTKDAHDRGAILVAAVFGAFLKVYRQRTADLFRISTNGTGILQEGDIHPDLAARLAAEAARCAQYVLQMCIRAIDYCPPVDITFGTYLRALVTSDVEFSPADQQGFRLAMVESFRQWGIHAIGSSGVSAESLLWPTGEILAGELGLEDYKGAMEDLFLERYRAGSEDDAGEPAGEPRTFKPWDLDTDRFTIWQGATDNAKIFWPWLVGGKGRALGPMLGLKLDTSDLKSTVFISSTDKGRPATEVHSVRRALRRTARGGTVTDIVVEITQRRRGYFDPGVQRERDRPGAKQRDDHDFMYRTGCTLIIDPQKMEIRRVIRTEGTINDDDKLQKVRAFLTGMTGHEPMNAFDPPDAGMGVGKKWEQPSALREPFAFLHHHDES